MLQECKLNSTLDSSRGENERSVSSSYTDTPRPEKLKRRWLREALTNDNISPKKTLINANVSPKKTLTNANMTRPTVLMMANKSPGFQPTNTSTPAKPSLTRALQNAEKQWTGAIALMQLATSSTTSSPNCWNTLPCVNANSSNSINCSKVTFVGQFTHACHWISSVSQARPPSIFRTWLNVSILFTVLLSNSFFFYRFMLFPPHH